MLGAFLSAISVIPIPIPIGALASATATTVGLIVRSSATKAVETATSAAASRTVGLAVTNPDGTIMVATKIAKVVDNGDGTITATVKDAAGATSTTLRGVAIQGAKNLFMFLEYTGFANAGTGALSTEVKSVVKMPRYDKYALGMSVCCTNRCDGDFADVGDYPCGGTGKECDPGSYMSQGNPAV